MSTALKVSPKRFSRRRARLGLKIATAESCTGGLVAAEPSPQSQARPMCSSAAS